MVVAEGLVSARHPMGRHISNSFAFDAIRYQHDYQTLQSHMLHILCARHPLLQVEVKLQIVINIWTCHSILLLPLTKKVGLLERES